MKLSEHSATSPHRQTSKQVVRFNRKHVALWHKVVLMVLCHTACVCVCVCPQSELCKQTEVFYQSQWQSWARWSTSCSSSSPCCEYRAEHTRPRAHTPINNANVTSSHKHWQDGINSGRFKEASRQIPLSLVFSSGPPFTPTPTHPPTPPPPQPMRLNYNRDSKRRAG